MKNHKCPKCGTLVPCDTPKQMGSKGGKANKGKQRPDMRKGSPLQIKMQKARKKS